MIFRKNINFMNYLTLTCGVSHEHMTILENILTCTCRAHTILNTNKKHKYHVVSNKIVRTELSRPFY